MIKISTNKKFIYIYPAPKEDKGKIIIFIEGKSPIETDVLKGKSQYIIPNEIRSKVRGVTYA